MKPRLFTTKAIYERERRKERWLQIKEYLEAHPCIKCGEADPMVLDFHHIKGIKKFAIARAISAGYGLKTILKEIAKCVVVCANRHRRDTAKQQGWSLYERKEG